VSMLASCATPEEPAREPARDVSARDDFDADYGVLKCASLTAAMARHGGGGRMYEGHHWEPRRDPDASDGWACVLVANAGEERNATP
jgi:hypothetical protein